MTVARVGAVPTTCIAGGSWFDLSEPENEPACTFQSFGGYHVTSQQPQEFQHTYWEQTEKQPFAAFW